MRLTLRYDFTRSQELDASVHRVHAQSTATNATRIPAPLWHMRGVRIRRRSAHAIRLLRAFTAIHWSALHSRAKTAARALKRRRVATRVSASPVRILEIIVNVSLLPRGFCCVVCALLFSMPDAVPHFCPAEDATACTQTPCSSFPCLNQATCNANVMTCGDYQCLCATGWGGSDCGTHAACDSQPCQNSATCSKHLDAYKCACSSGYQGIICDTSISQDVCAASPCAAGATCTTAYTADTNMATVGCTCTAAQYGPLCECKSHAFR